MTRRRKQHGDKVHKERRTNNHWGAKPEDRAQKVGIMTYVIHLFSAHVEGVIEVEQAKDDSGHGKYPEKVDGIPWIKKYGCKKYGRNGPGSAYGIVINIIPLFDQRP